MIHVLFGNARRRGDKRNPPGTHDVQRRGRVRHGRARRMGGQALGDHVRSAPSLRIVRQTLRDHARPPHGCPRRVRRRHAREQDDPPRVKSARDWSVLHRRCAQRPRDTAGEDARPPHGNGPPPLRSRRKGLRGHDGGGPLRGGRQDAGREDADQGRQQVACREACREGRCVSGRLGGGRRFGTPRLPRQGTLLRLRACLLRQQRRVLPSVERPPRAHWRACRVERGRARLDAPPPPSVRRHSDGGRRVRKRASRRESRGGDGMGLQVGAFRRVQLGGRRKDVPLPEGVVHIRRYARMVHGVAAHPPRVGRRDARDDARHPLDPAALLRSGRHGRGDASAFDIPQGHRRFCSLEREDRVRMRRHRKGGVPQRARRQGGAQDRRQVAVQPLVRRSRRARRHRSARRARRSVARRRGFAA